MTDVVSDDGEQIQSLAEAALQSLDANVQGEQEAEGMVATSPAPAPVGRFHAAAAVLASFDHDSLRPVPPTMPGIEPDDDGIEAVIRDSKLVAAARSRERWALRTDVRRDVLARLGGPQQLQAALAANPQRDRDEPAQAAFESYLGGTARPLESLDIRSLTGVLQVLDWLEGLKLLHGLPTREAVQRRYDLKTLMQPFAELATTNFAGRVPQLERLRAYVGVLPPGSWIESIHRIAESVLDLHEKPPLVVWGVGGVGKSTLISRFIWEHATLADTERFPWAYIDFDRPGMLAEDPLTLLIEAVRQLGIQYPEAREYCDRVRQQWLQRLINRPPEIRRAMTKKIKRSESIGATQLLAEGSLRDALVSFADLLDNLKVDTRPFLLVLDTFEQVQYRSSAVVNQLLEFLADFQVQVPRLRTVIVGRAQIADNAPIPTDPLELGNFDIEAAQGFLASEGIASPEAAKRIFGTVGGSPMSLRLAAETYRQTGAIPENSRWRSLFGFRLQDNEIQAQLFARILNHIHDEDVRKLAYPGLILRRVTAEIIRDVLAGPCGVTLDGAEAAQQLFEEMAREVSLVRIQDDVLVYRADVRGIVLKIIYETKPRQVRQIAEAAVAYYESSEESLGDNPAERLAARAEELYHRLQLQQRADVLAARWLPELQPYLANAVDELPLRERAWLATRLGRSLSPEERAQVDLDGWERDTLQLTRDLLRRGRPDMALSTLKERPQRLPGSPLLALEVEALELTGNFTGVRNVVDAGIASADAAGQRDLAIVLRIRGARADMYDGLLPEASAKLEEARSLANDISPLRAMEVQLHQLALCRAKGRRESAEADALLQSLATELEAISDGDIVDQGPLMAWLAAQLAFTAPTALARILRLNGLAAKGQRRLRELAMALVAWDVALPSPGMLADKAGAPVADSLTERWTQLVVATPGAELGKVLASLIDDAQADVPPAVRQALVVLLMQRAGSVAVPGDTLAPARSGQSADKAARAEELVSPSTRGAPAAARIRLSARQVIELAHLVAGALPSRQELALMTTLKLGRNLESIALTDDPQEAALKLTRVAEAEGWLAQLIVAARESNPGHGELHRFAEQFGLAVNAGPTSENAADWRAWLGWIETQVCSVELGDGQVGTGFLVGPDLVLTAYHCVQAAIEAGSSRGLACRFDRQALPGGEVVTAGTLYPLPNKDWLVNYAAPRKPLEAGSLDYALLRMARPAGAEPVGGDRASPKAPPRRWLALSASDGLSPTPPLLVFYYPFGRSLQLAFSDPSTEVMSNSIGVLFAGGVEPGASGAPCFDGRRQLVGMVIGRSPHGAATVVSSVRDLAEHIQQAGSAGDLEQVLA